MQSANRRIEDSVENQLKFQKWQLFFDLSGDYEDRLAQKELERIDNIAKNPREPENLEDTFEEENNDDDPDREPDDEKEQEEEEDYANEDEDPRTGSFGQTK